jgi:hypothetical protein
MGTSVGTRSGAVTAIATADATTAHAVRVAATAASVDDGSRRPERRADYVRLEGDTMLGLTYINGPNPLSCL